jgi:aryl-alcohol dehydrogenase-like predicted oxidoreductase
MLGTAWHEYQPPTDKEKSFKLLDAFVAAGGNFFDTANGYSVSTLSFR